MASAVHQKRTSRWSIDRIPANVSAVAADMAADHMMALFASAKASTPRKNLAEVRAMYVAPRDAR